MKCHKPNTDQELELTVLANGIPCDEYILPSTSSSSSNRDVLECFIPVSEGDQLTITGSFTGSVLHASFDLLADGSFLADKRIEGPKTGEPKYYKKRKLDIKTVFDEPIPEGHTSIFSPDKIVEGNLHVKALRDEYEGSPLNVDAKHPGVGSLVVICSLNQRTSENYVEKYVSDTCGNWASRGHGDAEDVTDGGIRPTHETEVKVTDEEVSKTRQQKHKRHFIQTRFGLKPWTKFIFYYRSKEAIEEAGCEKRMPESRALEAADERTFIHASTETAARKGAAAGTRSKKTAGMEVRDDDEITVASRVSRANSIFTTPPPPSESSRATPSFAGGYGATLTPVPEAPKKPLEQGLLSPPPPEPSPRTEKKKKLFGQTLSLPSSAATSPVAQHGRKSAPPTALDAMLEDARREHESGGGGGLMQQITPFAVFNKTLEKLPTTGFPQSQEDGNALPQVSDGELANAIAGAKAFLTDTPQPAPLVAQMAPQMEEMAADEERKAVNAQQTQSQPVRVKEEEGIAPSLDSSPNTGAPSNNSRSRSRPRTDETHTNSILAFPTSLKHLDGSMTSPLQSQSHASPTSPQPSQSSTTTEEDLPPCTLTPSHIIPEIPAEGIKLNDLLQCFDEDVLPGNKRSRQKFVWLVKKVAVNVEDRYFLKTSSQGSDGSQALSQPGTLVESLEVEAAAQQVANAKPTAKIVPDSETSPHKDTTPLSKQLEQQDQKQHQHFPTPPPSTISSKKRSASAMATPSRSTTPSKKPRFDALSSKKAELLKQIGAKRQRKIAAQKALEEQQKLRQEEEEAREKAEMREIEMLERLAAEEEEEVERLERMRVEEEEGLEEARGGRERAEEAVRLGEESDG